MSQHHKPQEEELDIYGDGSIKSADAPVPQWLKWVYVIMPIWGIIWFILYWNGSSSFQDKARWFQLQKAANTTFPYINADEPPPQSDNN